MRGAADAWDDPRGAEAYALAVRSGTLYRDLARRLAARLAPRGRNAFLDLASGTGIVAEALYARAGRAARIAGLDAAHAMLAVAARALPEGAAAFVQADPAGLPFAAQTFDGIACSAAFWHFPRRAATFAEAARVLHPGGALAFNVPAAQLEGEPGPPPAPLQLALATEGRARFGDGPAPAGPVVPRAALLAAADEAGFDMADEAWFDAEVAQREMADLLDVPAIGARAYPLAPAVERAAWIAAAVARIDPHETVRVRWWEPLFVRREERPARWP